MTPDPLALPVATSMRSTEMLHPEDSLDRACALLRNTAYPFVPIVDGDRLLTCVSEASIAQALGEAHPLSEPCTLASTSVPTIHPQASGAEALRKLSAEGHSALLVLDDDGHVAGVVGPSDLVPQPRRDPIPPTIGGMATPLGVYLTTGSIHGGAGALALALSGALLFSLFLLTDQVVLAATNVWPRLLPFSAGIGTLCFLLSIRLIPLSGTHAAEHMVVHAIERGEPLIPSVVRRMPRVHPRCGTNLAVAGTLFMGLFNWNWTQDQSLRLLAALIVSYVAYRPLGSLAQLLITTKPPSQKQLEGGIRAGKELLDRYRRQRGPVASPWKRILNSGMLHVMAGSSGAYLVAKGIAVLFKLPFDL